MTNVITGGEVLAGPRGRGARPAVDATSNEIPAVRALLKAFTDLGGAAITIPATSAVSTGRGRRARRTIKAVLVPGRRGRVPHYQ
jgi:hypothetical protein